MATFSVADFLTILFSIRDMKESQSPKVICLRLGLIGFSCDHLSYDLSYGN